MRRLGKLAWYAEVGVPMPIAWLVLQLVFDNASQIVGALAVGCLGVWALWRYQPLQQRLQ